MQESLEMVICPVCKKPFPKRRRDLGYKCCVNCSTEESVSCIVEGSMEGDGDDTVHSSLVIVSKEQARAIENSRYRVESEVLEDSLEESREDELTEEDEMSSGFIKRSEEDMERFERDDEDPYFYGEDCNTKDDCEEDIDA